MRLQRFLRTVAAGATLQTYRHFMPRSWTLGHGFMAVALMGVPLVEVVVTGCM